MHKETSMAEEQASAEGQSFWQKLKGWFTKAKESEAAEKAGDMAEKAWDKTKDVAEKTWDKTKDVAEDVKEKVEDKLEDIRDKDDDEKSDEPKPE
jgi:hypothetical protein